MKAVTREDLPVTIEQDGVELRTGRLGELTVGWMRLPKGADLAPATRGLPEDRCPCPHWGYMLSGRVLMKTADGGHVYQAGEAFYWAPGHVPEALEDSEYVDFSPTHQFDAVIEHIKAGSPATS